MSLPVPHTILHLSVPTPHLLTGAEIHRALAGTEWDSERYSGVVACGGREERGVRDEEARVYRLPRHALIYSDYPPSFYKKFIHDFCTQVRRTSSKNVLLHKIGKDVISEKAAKQWLHQAFETNSEEAALIIKLLLRKKVLHRQNSLSHTYYRITNPEEAEHGSKDRVDGVLTPAQTPLYDTEDMTTDDGQTSNAQSTGSETSTYNKRSSSLTTENNMSYPSHSCPPPPIPSSATKPTSLHWLRMTTIQTMPVANTVPQDVLVSPISRVLSMVSEDPEGGITPSLASETVEPKKEPLSRKSSLLSRLSIRRKRKEVAPPELTSSIPKNAVQVPHIHMQPSTIVEEAEPRLPVQLSQPAQQPVVSQQEQEQQKKAINLAKEVSIDKQQLQAGIEELLHETLKID